MARLSAIDMKTTRSDGSRYKASLQDGENRRLSIGQALLRIDYACFWPHSQKDGYYDLHERAKSLGVKSLWLTNEFGTMSERRLRTLYRLCEVYVQPSYSEGFGLPILEAFRFNKPVIAVHAPPFEEIIEDEATGILFPSNGTTWHKSVQADLDLEIHEYSPSDLAKAIRNLVNYRQLLAKMEHQVEKEKWKWNAKAVYPEFLNYLN